MSRKPTRPLKITAKLIDGRINSTDGIIMFDSILYHAWFLKYAPEVLNGGGIDDLDSFHNVPSNELPAGITRRNGKTFLTMGLPIKRENEIYSASMGIYEQVSETIEYWNKRPDFFANDKIDFLDANKGLISDSVGTFRAYRTPVVARTVKNGIIDFYCMGSEGKIMDLLSYIHAVGKKPSMGWGLVSDWTIEEIESDYSFYHPEYGLMRPVPVDGLSHDGYKIMDYAIRPPYWKRCNYRRCYVPNAIRQ